MLTLLAVPTVAFADDQDTDPEWKGGSIKMEMEYVKESYRTEMQYPKMNALNWAPLPYFANGSAVLMDENRDPIASYSGESIHTFTGLSEGKYILRINNLDSGKYVLFDSFFNGTSGPMSQAMYTQEEEIEITKSNPEVWKIAVLEYKAFDYKLVTDIGTFENGTKENDFFPAVGPNGVRNWSEDNEDPGTKGRAPILGTHSGIYYGEKLSQYGKDALKAPKLSKEEKAKGYAFKGWQLVGGDPDEIYTESEALAYPVTKDTAFKAVWDYPTHKVTFKTNRREGTLSPADGEIANVYSYDVNYNNQKLSQAAGEKAMAPSVEPKPGYQFVGWYMDPTRDILTTEEISNMVVNKDITFYALYEAAPDIPVVTKANEDPTTPTTPAESEKALDRKITATDTDGDFVGSTFGHLRARGVSKGKRKVLLKWTDPKLGAAKYVVYGNRCNTKGKKYYYVKLKEFDSNTLRYTPAKIHGKKLKKGTYYKFLVMAVDKNGKVLAISKTVHVTTKGKRGNDKAVKRVKPTKKAGHTLNAGAVKKLKVKEIKGKKKVARHRAVAWESLNPKVATVDKTGNVTAKGAGTCTIFAYAQNGVYTTFQITVK